MEAEEEKTTRRTPAARAPVATDHVIIPSGAAHMPVLPVSAAVASINLQSGATLTLGNRSLTVAGVSTLAGKLVFSGAGEFNALGDVNCSGGIVAAQSVFRLAGASPQNATFNGITLYEFSIENPSVTLGGDFACNRFTVGDGATACDVGFSSGMTMAPAEFNVSGDTSVTNVTLHAAPPSGTWHLNASKASVSGAKVSGSDASEGVMVVPVACADEGGNSNWLFNDTRAKWSGAADSAFDNTANWQGATVPGADDDVLVAVANPMVISSGASLHSLTLADGASVTIDSALAVAGSVTVGDGATLAWNRPGTIGGNLAVHAGGTLTHSGNTTTEANKLDLAVGGNGLIESGAEVDVKGKGYMTGKGPGWGVTAGGAGASHGGRGYKSNPIGVNKVCYGSVLCPTNCGSGGLDNTYPGYGGGVAVLKFTGALVLDGEIDADGTGVSFYTASGGSVWISAASLTGGGAVHAHGGDGTASNLGGGGRIAAYVTAARDTGGFIGTLGAHGGAQSGVKANGSAGTVYIETAANQAGRGMLLIANKPNSVNQKPDEDMTDLPSGSLCAANEGRDVFVDVGYYGTLNLTADFRVSDLRLIGSTSRVKLNGHTLGIRARRHALGVNETAQVIPGGTEENPGRIVWLPGSTLIFLR